MGLCRVGPCSQMKSPVAVKPHRSPLPLDTNLLVSCQSTLFISHELFLRHVRNAQHVARAPANLKQSWRDFLEYISLVKWGHMKLVFLILFIEVKIITYYDMNMVIVIRKTWEAGTGLILAKYRQISHQKNSVPYRQICCLVTT